jgi:hypothetical protein
MLLPATVWAGTRQDPFGNRIREDVVANGGGRVVSGQWAINGSVGQTTAGRAVSLLGENLYHGVHGPVASPSDADSDGLTDEDEAALGTDPHNPDSDRDGLTDGLEVHVYDTNPRNPDSDGDGVADGMEVTFGYDPTDPGETPELPAISTVGIVALVAGLGLLLALCCARKAKGGP